MLFPRILPLAALLLGASPALSAQELPEDRGMLTRLRVVIDSVTFRDVLASEFIPEAFDGITDSIPGEVTMCGRFACLVFALMTPDQPLGAVELGVRAATGLTLTPPPADSLPLGVALVDAAPPPPPDFMTDPDSLGIIHDLSVVQITVPLDAMVPLGQALHRAGIRVDVTGSTLTVTFGAATLILTQAFDDPGIERIGFVLRYEAPGNPTYRFGPKSALRFGPGREANWSF
jgi:hypothetical protein